MPQGDVPQGGMLNRDVSHGHASDNGVLNS
jgi:hypothetical protein